MKGSERKVISPTSRLNEGDTRRSGSKRRGIDTTRFRVDKTESGELNRKEKRVGGVHSISEGITEKNMEDRYV